MTNDDGYRRLAAAVVIQAVEDWRTLCRWMKEGRIVESFGGYTLIRSAPGSAYKTYRRQFSFDELRIFFYKDIEGYCDLDPDFVQLKLEREYLKAKEAKRNVENKTADHGETRVFES